MSLYSQSRLGELFKLIRKDNPNLTTEMSADNVTAGAPAANAGTKNTSITVTGVKYKGYRGSKQVFYNRIDLGVLHKNVTPHVIVPPDADRTLHAVLPQINAQLGIFLETTDFADQQLVMDPVTMEFKATLTMGTTHPLYTGSVSIVFRGFAVSMESLVVIRDLDLLKDNSPHQAGRYCASLLTYGVDYSAISAYLKTFPNVTTSTAFTDAQARDIARMLTMVDGLPWTFSSLAAKPFNTRGMQYLYNGPPIPQFAGSALNPDPDYRYDRMMILSPHSTLCTNLAPAANGWGLIIHYDLVEE